MLNQEHLTNLVLVELLLIWIQFLRDHERPDAAIDRTPMQYVADSVVRHVDGWIRQRLNQILRIPGYLGSCNMIQTRRFSGTHGLGQVILKIWNPNSLMTSILYKKFVKA